MFLPIDFQKTSTLRRTFSSPDMLSVAKKLNNIKLDSGSKNLENNVLKVYLFDMFYCFQQPVNKHVKVELTPIMEDLRELCLSSQNKKVKDDFELELKHGNNTSFIDESRRNLTLVFNDEKLTNESCDKGKQLTS